MSWKLIGGYPLSNDMGLDIYRNEEEDVWGVKPWFEDAELELVSYDDEPEEHLIWGRHTIYLKEVIRVGVEVIPDEDTKVIIGFWKLRELCINQNWFTCGTSVQYNKLFDMAAAGATIHDLALIIWLCSDGVSQEDISKKLYEFKSGR